MAAEHCAAPAIEGAATTSVVVCKMCGSAAGFREVGEVRCSATRDTRGVERGPDGKPSVSWDYSPDVDTFDADYIDVFHVECRDCGAEAARVEDLAGSPLTYRVGARVTCPDGLRGVVANVDFESKRLTVEGWHEEFAFGDVHAVDPMVDPLVAA